MTDVITLENVSFAYDDQPVLENVSLAVEEGAFLGLVGPNGSGKTTLLKIMLGLQRPDSGTASLFGTPATAFREGARLGYVSQQSTESDAMMPVTVREVVRMGRYAHAGIGRLSAVDRAAVDDAIRTVGITDLEDRRISQLSGGQRQRAYIARALASEAELLALDEPTVGVDTDSVEAFYALLDDLHRQGITVVLIEHDIGLLAEHAETMACLDGKLYEHCDTQSFLEGNALQQVFSSARIASGEPLATGD